VKILLSYAYILVSSSATQQYEKMETKAERDEITAEFGDLFVHNLIINFQRRITEIYFGENITENSNTIKKMIFENVVWQEFSEFDFCNIFNSIEIDNDFNVFKKKHFEYFEKMKNYISHNQLEEINAPGNRYYTFLQTCGFNCFIIAKNDLKIDVIA
jgi:hypothetical protein